MFFMFFCTFFVFFFFCISGITFEPNKIQTCSAPQNESLNLSFVKDINVVSNKLARNCRKTAIQASRKFNAPPRVGVFHFSIQLLLSEFRVRAEGIFRVIEHENLTLCRTSRLNRHCFHVFVDSYTLVHSRLEPLIYICLMHMEMQHTFFLEDTFLIYILVAAFEHAQELNSVALPSL